MRNLPDPGFPDDSGEASEALVTALRAYDADPAGLADATLEVLQHERLLVPVVAVLGEVEVDEAGLAHDKTSDMATVLTTGRDGRTALLAFTSTTALQRWDPQARPVPVSASRAAEAAVQDGASAMVVDVAGPVLFVVETADLRELAAGHTLAKVNDGYAWVRPVR